MAIEHKSRQGQRRFVRLKRKHFKPEGREDRIREALKALEEAVVRYKADPEFVRWIAQEGDQEDL